MPETNMKKLHINIFLPILANIYYYQGNSTLKSNLTPDKSGKKYSNIYPEYLSNIII